MRLSANLALLMCTGVLGGCANPNFLVVGQSTVEDVRARMGTPTDSRVDRSGDQVWEYATGPEGFDTHRIRIGTDGKVKDVTRLLTEEQLANVIPGKMNRGEVRDLLGRPTEETTYLAGLTWSWRFRQGDLQPGFLVVTFNPDGTVNSKFKTIDPACAPREN